MADTTRPPRTEAGRKLHQHLLEVHRAGYIGGTTWDRIERGIPATEAEAAAPDAGLREALERLVEYVPVMASSQSAIDAARAALGNHAPAGPAVECPSCDDSWAAHVAGLHDEV